MEIRNNNIIGGKGLYATRSYKSGDVVFILTGKMYDSPTRETIHIGNNKHIYDENGMFINHSFRPSTRIDSTNVIALLDIQVDDEITFNYNDSEIKMASPFYADNVLVCGK